MAKVPCRVWLASARAHLGATASWPNCWRRRDRQLFATTLAKAIRVQLQHVRFIVRPTDRLSW
eukprot:4635217-Alexandrium_andersonii.AAC.1